jgi:competence protein ComEA
MFYSLLLKLTLLVVTMGMVFWIGWTVPEPRDLDADRGPHVPSHNGTTVFPLDAPGGSPATVVSPRDQDSTRSSASQQAVVRRLDLNRATEQDLEALPGIGPVLAERIVQYRQSRGAFQEVGQLREVKGIGKKTFDRIRHLVGVMPPSSSTPGGRKAT